MQKKSFYGYAYNDWCESEQLHEVLAKTSSSYVTKTSGYIVTAGMGSGGSSAGTASVGAEERNNSVPEKAYKIVQQIKERNGAPLPGYKGGRIYRNEPEDGCQKLPDGVKYREYDINPYSKGTNRGQERIVIGDNDSAWYTNDHYVTFIQMH